MRNRQEWLDEIDIDDLGLGLELLAAQGLWTEELRDWVFPVIKKDPGYVERVMRAKGVWQNKS